MAIDQAAGQGATAAGWSPSTRWRRFEAGSVVLFLLACAAVTVLTTVGIVLALGIETVNFFRVAEVGPLAFVFGTETGAPKFGILPLIWGTFAVAAGSALVGLPIGLLSAIYLSEYAPRGLRAVLKPTLELLAGVPSIVYGFLAWQFVTPALKVIFNPLLRATGTGLEVETFNVMSASLVVGIMIIPLVSSLSEDVLSAVPRGLREAAYGLGATKFEVSTKVVLPSALSGVVASFILAISRAVGETMAVTLAAGSVAQITLNPFTSIETMTAYMVAVLGGEAAPGSAEWLSLFAVGMVLFSITLALNLASGLVLRRYREAVH